jgi:hypothetical protein
MPPREPTLFDEYLEIPREEFTYARQPNGHIEREEVRQEREDVYAALDPIETFGQRFARAGQIAPDYGTVRQKTIQLQMEFNVDTDMSENTTDWISIYLLEGNMTIGRINTIATTPYTHFITEYQYTNQIISPNPEFKMVDLLQKLIDKFEEFDYVEHLIIEIYENEIEDFRKKEFFEEHGFEVMSRSADKIWMILNLQ